MTITKAVTIAKAAERLVGVRFKLHGRDPAIGLDCVGVVLHALGAAGLPVSVEPRYALRGFDPALPPEIARNAGLATMDGDRPMVIGDIALAIPGPAQLHLLVRACPNSFVHAHASLRRIVRAPAPCPWPVATLFRFCEKEH